MSGNSFRFSSHQSPASLPSPSFPATPILHPIFLVMFVFCPYLPPEAQALPSARHPLLPSISACLSRRVLLLIIPSPSPSSVTPEFIPLHQFAPTVNCVENNSACRVFRPGWDYRSDVMGMAVGVETALLGYTHS